MSESPHYGFRVFVLMARGAGAVIIAALCFLHSLRKSAS
jgi:hypothetical protein